MWGAIWANEEATGSGVSALGRLLSDLDALDLELAAAISNLSRERRAIARMCDVVAGLMRDTEGATDGPKTD